MSSAEILRTARGRAGLTQRQLAFRASTSQDAISRIERGAEIPTVERLQKLLRAAGAELALLEPTKTGPDAPAMSPAERLRESASWNLAATTLELAGARAREAGHPATRLGGSGDG